MHILIDDRFDYRAERAVIGGGYVILEPIDPSIGPGSTVRIIEPALFEDHRESLRVAMVEHAAGGAYIRLERLRQ